MDYKARCFHDKESFSMYAAAIIAAQRTVINTFEAIKIVARKMNGKVYNKRFTTAVEEQLKNMDVKSFVSSSDNYNLGYHTLYIYLDRRDVCINGTTYYFDKEIEGSYIHNVQKSMLTDDRIDCEKTFAVCDEMIKYCNESISKWDDAAEHFDEYNSQLMDAVKEFGDKIKGLNKLFKPYELHAYDWEH